MQYINNMKEIMPGITIDLAIRGGKPVITGTRVPVDLIVGHLAGGMTVEEIMHEYDLTRDNVLAAMKYAAFVVDNERVFA